VPDFAQGRMPESRLNHRTYHHYLRRNLKVTVIGFAYPE
jgi:hypothetical protein